MISCYYRTTINSHALRYRAWPTDVTSFSVLTSTIPYSKIFKCSSLPINEVLISQHDIQGLPQLVPCLACQFYFPLFPGMNVCPRRLEFSMTPIHILLIIPHLLVLARLPSPQGTRPLITLIICSVYLTHSKIITILFCFYVPTLTFRIHFAS